MTTQLTTALAIEAVAWERAPRYSGRNVNRRVICADGFAISIQASEMHYAHDSGEDEDRSPYWRGVDPEVFYPFTTFELGNPSEADLSALAEWESGGIWAWVPRQVVSDLLDAHGGAVSWEAVHPIRAKHQN